MKRSHRRFPSLWLPRCRWQLSDADGAIRQPTPASPKGPPPGSHGLARPPPGSHGLARRALRLVFAGRRLREGSTRRRRRPSERVRPPSRGTTSACLNMRRHRVLGQEANTAPRGSVKAQGVRSRAEIRVRQPELRAPARHVAVAYFPASQSPVPRSAAAGRAFAESRRLRDVQEQT